MAHTAPKANSADASGCKSRTVSLRYAGIGLGAAFLFHLAFYFGSRSIGPWQFPAILAALILVVATYVVFIVLLLFNLAKRNGRKIASILLGLVVVPPLMLSAGYVHFYADYLRFRLEKSSYDRRIAAALPGKPNEPRLKVFRWAEDETSMNYFLVYAEGDRVLENDSLSEWGRENILEVPPDLPNEPPSGCMSEIARLSGHYYLLTVGCP